MLGDSRFWRNVTIIAVAHIAVLVALVRLRGETRKLNLQSIVWMSGEMAAMQSPARTETPIETTQPPEFENTRSQQERDEPPSPALATSDIQLPSATPSPTPVPTPPPKPSITPVPKASPKPTPKPKPKKLVAKVTPSPSSKKDVMPARQPKETDQVRKDQIPTNMAVPGERSGSTATSGAAQSAAFSRYGKMLHDRFYSEWSQPTTSIPIGTKMSTLVRIRIEKDGRVSKFAIAKPSGNVVVDESVAAVAKRVTQVDPLPSDLGGDAFYEVNIKFELNPDQ